MMRFRQSRIGFELGDQPIVGEGLAQSVPGVERDNKEQQNDGDVVRGGEDCPELA
jgi:hypothetical protein